MLTIENTDAAIKKFESHVQRATIENKAGLVATTTDNLEIIALKAKVAQLESNVAINAVPVVKRKRHDNNKKTGPKAIATCTVCQKTGHKAEGCWFGAENKIRDAELALAKPSLRGNRSLRQRELLPMSVRCSQPVLLLIHRSALLNPLILSRVSFLRHACLLLLRLSVG
jgi:hypothetical protein